MTPPERKPRVRRPDPERKLRQDLRKSWHMMVISFVCAFLAAGSAMAYANRVARESERKWCNVVATMDDSWRETPPESPAGRQLAADIRKLRADFHCPRVLR